MLVYYQDLRNTAQKCMHVIKIIFDKLLNIEFWSSKHLNWYNSFKLVYAAHLSAEGRFAINTCDAGATQKLAQLGKQVTKWPQQSVRANTACCSYVGSGASTGSN